MQADIIANIKKLALQYNPLIVEVRRDLHQHPELSFEEIRTSQRVIDFLKQKQIPFTTGWAGHGIVATINGNKHGRKIMLRADMDALPIQEANDVPYKSSNERIMHACGHDVHTSSLLGTAAILNEIKEQLAGEVTLIFQPGEEKLPGGASVMIQEGLLKKHRSDCIIAQHVFPSLPAGHVGFKSGMYMASADEIYINIKGKGGHAATPHLCIDPIVVASHVIIQLQEVISRHQDPISPGVLTIGKINSDGGATNIIPEQVKMEGTLRTMDEKWRYKAHDLIRQVIENVCKASGATAEVRIDIGYPSLKNDEPTTSFCKSSAIKYLGEERVHDLPARMSSEDFAFYSHELPGTFYRLGTGWNDPSKDFQVHSSRFNIDESALETGMGLMAYLAFSFLQTS